MKKSILTGFILLLFIGYTSAQGGQFSQFYSSAIFVNPAFAGTNPYLSARVNFNKSKLAGDGSLHDLSQATVSYPVFQNTSRKFQVGGAGLTFFKETQGILGAFSTQKILLTGAYALKLKRLRNNTLIFGLQGGVTQTRISLNGLQWGSQYNPYIGFDNSQNPEDIGKLSSYHPVFNFGVLYSAIDNPNAMFRDRSFTVGLSADNLNTPKSRFGGLYLTDNPIMFKLVSNAKFILAPKTFIHPSLLTVFSSQSYQVNLGTYLSHQINSTMSDVALTLQVGTWYRLLDSFIVLGGMKINDFTVGASYDLNTNTYGSNEIYGQIAPSFEISLGYDFNFRNNPFKVNSPIF
jgi:type IX secretion system PorP/SprF family membrane protein